MLMFSLPSENWWRLFVWLFIGFVIYFGYGKKHSFLARGIQPQSEPAAVAARAPVR
jgi:APA family basic amino acid/polyamine antiporter